MEIRMDNGNVWDVSPFLRTECPTLNGHLLVLLKAGTTPGKVSLTLYIEDFGPREIQFTLH